MRFLLLASGSACVVRIRTSRRVPCTYLVSESGAVPAFGTTTMLGLSASVAADDVCIRCVSGFVLKGERQGVGVDRQAAWLGSSTLGRKGQVRSHLRSGLVRHEPTVGWRRSGGGIGAVCSYLLASYLPTMKSHGTVCMWWKPEGSSGRFFAVDSVSG